MSSNLFVWMFYHEWVFDERQFYASDKMKLGDEWSTNYVSLKITTLIHFRDKLFFPIFLGMNYEKGFFFPSILWCSHSFNHPQEEELAKFVCRLERKVEKCKNPAIFWWLVGTFCLNMPSSGKLFPWKTLAHIFHKYPFIQSHTGSFVTKVKNSKIHQVKKTNIAD
jgi:hypothetical protein